MSVVALASRPAIHPMADLPLARWAQGTIGALTMIAMAVAPTLFIAATALDMAGLRAV